MYTKTISIAIAVLLCTAFLLHCVSLGTNSWIVVRPYYEDFLWKGCYKKKTEIGCDRLPEYKGGAAMVALRTTAVNYSLVGEKPYDLVYGGLWKACLVKDNVETCEPLLVGQGQRINTDWIRTVQAFSVLVCVCYICPLLIGIGAKLKRSSEKYRIFMLLGCSVFVTFLIGSIGLFVFSGWSDVSIRYKNYYGYSFFLGAFGCVLLYIAFMLSFIAGCKAGSKKNDNPRSGFSSHPRY